MKPSLRGSTSPGSSPTRRKQSTSGTSLAAQNATPTTFFMASESMLDADQTPTASVADPTFGVRSISDDLDGGAENEREEGRRRSTIIGPPKLFRDESKDSLSMGSNASGSSNNSSPSPSRQPPHTITTNPDHPGGSFLFQSPILGTSEPSSPKSTSVSSFRPSDDDLMDDRSSQAVLSDSEDDGVPTTGITDNVSAPQFIMPSIMMPSRRPFSDEGSSLGRLKVLLAGSSGVGKTSLIKSIVQTCEDIVHIDASIPTNVPAKGTKTSSKGYNRTKQISETYASTKAYPTWWSDLEENSILRRRRSGDGTVLERNICFVDTPGYDSGTSILEGWDKVIRYIESQINKMLDTKAMENTEIMHMLGGGGGSQVDVVLYLLAHPVKPADLEFIKQVSPVTNVIPVLAKADTLPANELEHIKASISEDLASAELKLFQPSTQNHPYHIYTICSSPSKDLESMDASLLMQSDYVQPLHASELTTLVEHLFSSETIHKLKYFAAKKVVQYRQTPQISTISQSPLQTSISPKHNIIPSPSTSKSLSQALVPRTPGTITYNQAAVTDHTLREERLARIQLANWATNLQRSLANERARYEAIAKGERAEWLKARLGECVFEQNLEISNTEGQLIPSSKPRTLSATKQPQLNSKMATHMVSRSTLRDPSDPLGLLYWRDEFSSSGLLLLKVVSGASIIGALGTVLFLTARSWSEGNVFSEQTASLKGWWESFR